MRTMRLIAMFLSAAMLKFGKRVQQSTDQPPIRVLGDPKEIYLA